VDDVASAAVKMLDAEGWPDAVFAAHSYGTFCVSRVCQRATGLRECREPQIGADGHGRAEPKHADQQRRHQRAAADPCKAYDQADNKTGKHKCEREIFHKGGTIRVDPSYTNYFLV
jgi:hypothetical protein